MARLFFFWGCIALMIEGKASTPLLKQLHTATHDTVRIRICSELAQHFRGQDKPDSSLLYVRQGLSLEKKWGITTYHSDLYRHWGLYFRAIGQLDKAETVLRKAWNWGCKHHQNHAVEKAGYALATVYADKASKKGKKEDHYAMITQIYTNLRFSSQHQSFARIMENYILLSHIHGNYGNDSLHYFYLEKALTFQPKNKSLYDSLFLLSKNLELHLYHKQTLQAKADLQQLLKFEGNEEIAFYYNYILFYGLIDSYIKFNDFSQALLLAQRIQNNPGMMASMNDEDKTLLLCYFVEIYLYQKKYKEAQQSYHQLMPYAKGALPMWIKLKILVNQEKLLEFENKYNKAFQVSQQIKTIQDSLSTAQYTFELAAGQAQLENELLNQQLKVQQLENQQKLQTLKRNQQIQQVAVLAIFLMTVVIVTIALQMRKINRQALHLQQINANKDRLFSIIGHDLRGPVISLQTNLTYFVQHPPKKATLTQTLSKQLPRINNLLATLDNLLYWSITQRDTIIARQRPLSISSSIEDVLEWLQASIEEAQVQIHKNISEDASIFMDENHCRIILRNLIHNALKFTPKEGVITLTAQRIDDTVQLVIQDTGVGFSQTSQPAPQQGTQIGLKLVKELMEVNQGQFAIESIPGKGTTVRLTFPVAERTKLPTQHTKHRLFDYFLFLIP